MHGIKFTRNLLKSHELFFRQTEMNKLEEDNASQDLIVYSNHEWDSIVEKYAREVDTLAWIDKDSIKADYFKAWQIVRG